MKRFWMISVVACGFLLANTAGAAGLDEPGKKSSSDDDDICSKVAECGKKVVWSHRWVQCLIPQQTRVKVNDGMFKVELTEAPDWKPGEPCVCPDGFTLVRTNIVRHIDRGDDKVHKHAEIKGTCLPLNVSDNSEIWANALNGQRNDILSVSAAVTANRDEVVARIDTAAGKIGYNADDIDKLRDEQDGFAAFLNGACQAPNLPPNWQEVCDDRVRMNSIVTGLVQREKPLWFGLNGAYVHFSGRDYVGVGLDAALRTGRLGSEDSPLRLEFGGRASVGSAEDMDPEGSGDSGLAYLTTLHAGPTVDLDAEGQFVLHPRAFIEGAWRANTDEMVSRRYGGALAFSFCPSSTKDDPVSFCVMPEVNLGHGRSVFNQPAEPDSPKPKRGQSSVTGGVNVSFGGRF